MATTEISDDDLDIFTVIERVSSVLSLVGCIFIIATFCSLKSFHKPINRLVFYASIGNMMTNVATLMARTYVGMPTSAGCQLQAFLIQMFMPADAFWTLAMAVNVYLTFYYKYDAQKLRKVEVPYLALCYGLPFIVALVYVFVETPARGRVYGNATIWCWVQQTWDVWRIATFYGPVWVVIAVTFFIYIRAGREIFRKHRQLKDLNYTSHYDPEPLGVPANDPFNSKTTEVSVTVSNAQDAIDLSPLGSGAANKHQSISEQSVRTAAYSVSISARPTQIDTSLTTTTAPNGQSRNKSGRRATLDAHNAAWSYAKCALLFFTAMLVTWIPSSANRLYSLARNGESSLPLEYISAFVLPLQGFWNAIIYITTSWKACKMLVADAAAMFSSRGEPQTPPVASNSGFISGMRSRSRMGGSLGKEEGVYGGRARPFARNSKSSETESMEELANVGRHEMVTP